jgi:hypothetical protein
MDLLVIVYIISCIVCLIGNYFFVKRNGVLTLQDLILFCSAIFIPIFNTIFASIFICIMVDKSENIVVYRMKK